MFGKLAEKTAKNMVEKKLIEDDDFELYHYGLFIVMTDVFLLVVSILMGLVLKTLLSSIVFLVVFMLSRRYAGGMHVKTEACCLTLTLSFLLLSNIAIKLSLDNESALLCLILQSICTVILVTVSPVTTPQKELEESEKIMFKKLICIISVLLLISSFVLIYFHIYKIAFAITYAIVLEALLAVLGRLFNHRLKEEA